MPHEPNHDEDRLLATAITRSGSMRADLAVATTDLFLPIERRLTDQQRALMGDILNKLVRQIEFDLRRRLSDTRPELRATTEGSTEFAYPVLEASSALRGAELLSLVMRRAEEHRFSLNAPPQNSDAVEALLRSSDPLLARRAAEYVLTESRRHDRFREPLLLLDDLSDDLAYRLHWLVAAALRRSLYREAGFDQEVVDAVRHAMADHSEGHGAAARAMRVAARLHALGDLTDDLLVQLISEAQPTLFTAGLAVRAAIGFDVAWQVISDHSRETLLVLARAIDIARDSLAAIIRILDDSKPRFSPAASAIARYDDINPDHARDVLRFWRLDAGYRAAIDELEAGPTG